MNPTPEQPQYPSQQPPYPQYPPQQPYGALPPPPGYVAPTAQSPWGNSSLGTSANVIAALSYIPILGIIFYFIEKQSRFVRFHAAQSILLTIAAFIIGVGDQLNAIVFNGVIYGLFACLFGLLGLALFGFLIYGAISAYQNKEQKLPVIGEIAQQWANRPFSA